MKPSYRLVTLVVALLLAAAPLVAQDVTIQDLRSQPAASSPAAPGDAPQPARTGRPRIGLALGGGSARGFAHIGVLEWFEKNRIPIDYIAGTSMGGLVAGTYASGMGPEEVREMMKEVDWDLMFLADSPFKHKTFRRKQDRRAYPSQVEFGLKGGFRLPSGLNPGQQVALLLDHIALPYHDLATFDDLPTPYRCVATDLRQAEAIVLGKGSLSQAMRATMAIPGVFTPVNFDNWLLVDGGALNNVPADVVRQMGADIVISVNVGADPIDEKAEREAQQSLFALLGRTIDTMMTGAVRAALKNSDIVIDPDLRGLNSMDWRRSGDLADRGFQAAEAQAAKLAGYALSADDYAAFQAERKGKRRSRDATPAFLEVRGGSERDQAFISEQLQPHVGKPFDEPAFVDDLLGITGTDRFEFLTYRYSTRQDGSTGLLVGVRPKSYGPPFLSLSLELSNVDSSSFAVTLGGRVTAYDVAGAGSELRTDLILGTRQGVSAELYRPFGRSPLFVAPRGYFLRTGRNGYANEILVAEYRFKRTGAGLDLGWNSGRRAEVRFGADIVDVRGRVRIGDPGLPEIEGTEKFSTLQFTFDGQTSPIVPTRGVFTRSHVRRYFDTTKPLIDGARVDSIHDDEFWQGEFTASYFHRVHGENRVFVRGGAGTSFQANPLVNDFSLGGPLRLGAFNNDELRGDNYVLATGGYLHRFARLPDVLGGNIFLGGWLEHGSAFDAWRDADWHTSVSAGAIVETLLGPVFLGGSVGGGGRTRVYIAVGPLFR